MKNHLGRKACASVGAGLLALTLAGCKIGPVELPDIDLSFLDGIVTTTSVADAEAAFKAKKTSGIDSAELVSPGTLTVGLLPTATAPFYSASQDGSYVGINVELAYAVGEAVGLPVRFVTVSDATTSLGTTCDVVVGVSTSEAGSSEGVNVVGDYAETAIGLFGQEASSVQATDLSGKTVGVQPGSVSQRTVSGANIGAVEQSFTNINEAMSALGTGSIDYVVCDAYAGCYLAEDYDGVTLLGTLDNPVAMGVACRADKPTLSTAIQGAMDSVQGNGQLDVIKSRWVSGVGTLTAASMVQGFDGAAQAGAAPAADAPAE